MKRVLGFCLHFFSEMFLILTRIQRDITVNGRANCPLIFPDFNQMQTFSTDFCKTIEFHISL
jgi:hypothetical protein